ncbi:MAG TPA: hypothetical protein PLR60_10355 [Syntrophorhabdaceae bacterium]|nr:hypothetical protein [Syntrophorhabdaceae bacterium]
MDENPVVFEYDEIKVAILSIFRGLSVLFFLCFDVLLIMLGAPMTINRMLSISLGLSLSTLAAVISLYFFITTLNLKDVLIYKDRIVERRRFRGSNEIFFNTAKSMVHGSFLNVWRDNGYPYVSIRIYLGLLDFKSREAICASINKSCNGLKANPWF